MHRFGASWGVQCYSCQTEHWTAKKSLVDALAELHRADWVVIAEYHEFRAVCPRCRAAAEKKWGRS